MGDISIIQALLVFVVAFIMGIDQFSFLESLYQPIVTCPIIGAILGNFELGIVVGGAYQLIQIGSMPIGGAQPPNAILGGIMATIFAVSLDMEATADGVGAAMGLAIPFAVFGQYAVTLTFTFMSGMMAKADKYAEEANVKGIRNINFLEMAVLGCLFGVLAVAGLYGGTALGETLKDFSSVLMGNGRSGCSRRRYEVRWICYPDESYDVRRNVGIPSCRFRNGTYLCSKRINSRSNTSPLCIRRCSYCNL